MKYTVKYNGEDYIADDTKRFSEQNKRFITLWLQLDKTQGMEFQLAQVDNGSITVYDMGGIICNIIESKEDEDGE